MHYQIKLANSVNEIGKRFTPEIKHAAKQALQTLADNPNFGKELQAELSGFRSYRFLRYRIIYKVDTDRKRIVVWAIGHRRDIYETFGEHLLRQSLEK